jgi:pimeloyl-[acyl-carrier protein] methyl ester esterase
MERAVNSMDIVLLHGWGMHSGVWQSVAGRLAEEFRVTVIDLPGYGRSETISNYSSAAIVEEIVRVVPEHAMWIGWSLGGLIAMKVALCYPNYVDKLICVASTPKFLATKGWPGVDISLLQAFSQQLEIDYEGTLMRFLRLQFYGGVFDKKMLQWLKSTLCRYGRPTIQTLNAGLTILETEDFWQDLANLHCPLLYLLGRMDRLVPVQIAEILPQYKQTIDTVIFPKASHALFISHEDQFITEVRRFYYA